MARIEKLRDIVKHREAGLIEGFWIDLFTASMLVKIYDALNRENRVRFNDGRLRMTALVDFGWKQFKGTDGRQRG